MSVIEEISAERQRQIDVEGCSSERDDKYRKGELAAAAANYAGSSAIMSELGARSWVGNAPFTHFKFLTGWPWAKDWFKPETPRRALIKAAALIVAEIERLDRANGLTGMVKPEPDMRRGVQLKFAPLVEPDENGQRWGLSNLGAPYPITEDEAILIAARKRG